LPGRLQLYADERREQPQRHYADFGKQPDQFPRRVSAFLQCLETIAADTTLPTATIGPMKVRPMCRTSGRRSRTEHYGWRSLGLSRRHDREVWQLLQLRSNAYNVTGTDPGVGGSGFTVVSDGLVVAGNNPTAPTPASAPLPSRAASGHLARVGFAWSPERTMDRRHSWRSRHLLRRGELFTYLSPRRAPVSADVWRHATVSAGCRSYRSRYQDLENPLGTSGVLTSSTTPPAPESTPRSNLLR